MKYFLFIVILVFAFQLGFSYSESQNHELLEQQKMMCIAP